MVDTALPKKVRGKPHTGRGFTITFSTCTCCCCAAACPSRCSSQLLPLSLLPDISTPPGSGRSTDCQACQLSKLSLGFKRSRQVCRTGFSQG